MYDPSIGGGPGRSIAVGVTSQVVLGDSQYRKRVTFVNDSDTVIYLAKFENATLNTGIRLNANGGSLEDVPVLYLDAQGILRSYLYQGPWSAICSAANKNLVMQEN